MAFLGALSGSRGIPRAGDKAIQNGWCGDYPGTDRIYAYVLARIFNRGGARQVDYPGFGRIIGARTVIAAKPRDRGSINDRATTLGYHLRQRKPHPVEHSGEGNRESLLPAIERHFADRAEGRGKGIIEEHIQTAESVKRELDHSLYLS